jgi:acid phosphatase
MVIMEENHSQAEFMTGYLASLGSTYGQATNYHAIGHPSLPNYLEIFGGTNYGTSSDCGVGCGPTASTDRSVWDQTLAAGHSAKAYQESMPSNCATGGSGAYAPRHGPWPYWTNSTSRANCLANDVPLTALQGDINAGGLPTTGEVTPNLNDDAHDGTIAQANTFLQTWVPKLQAGPDYTSGNLTIIIVADEDDGSQGNLVPFVVVNKAISGKSVSLVANHYSLTRWLEDNAGVAHQNNAGSAADLKGAFGL